MQNKVDQGRKVVSPVLNRVAKWEVFVLNRVGVCGHWRHTSKQTSLECLPPSPPLPPPPHTHTNTHTGSTVWVYRLFVLDTREVYHKFGGGTFLYGLPGVVFSLRLMGMCRWMGSHFHDWTGYNGVAFSIKLLEWGRTFFGVLGVRQFFIFTDSKRVRMFVLQMKSKAFFIQFRKWVNS